MTTPTTTPTAPTPTPSEAAPTQIPERSAEETGVTEAKEDDGLDFFESLANLDQDHDENEGDGSAVAATPPAGGDGNVTPPAPVAAPTPTPAAPAATTPEATPPTSETPKPGEPAVTPPVQPAPAAAAPAATPPASPEQTAQTPQGQQTPTPTAADNEPKGDLLTQVRGELDKNRDLYTNALAEQVYSLSDDDAKALFETPEKVLPNLAAKVHVEVVQNVLGTLGQILPGLVHGISQVQKQNQTYLDQFWQAHPTLDPKTDRDTVFRLGQSFRQLYPNASFEEFKQTVGAQAMVILKKLPAAVAPAAPPAPVAPARAGAFVPAANGAPVGGPPAPRSAEDFWSGFAESLDET